MLARPKYQETILSLFQNKSQYLTWTAEMNPNNRPLKMAARSVSYSLWSVSEQHETPERLIQSYRIVSYQNLGLAYDKMSQRPQKHLRSK